MTYHWYTYKPTCGYETWLVWKLLYVWQDFWLSIASQKGDTFPVLLFGLEKKDERGKFCCWPFCFEINKHGSFYGQRADLSSAKHCCQIGRIGCAIWLETQNAHWSHLIYLGCQKNQDKYQRNKLFSQLRICVNKLWINNTV